MKVALAVIEIEDYNIKNNIKRMKDLIKKASEFHVDYIFFGESVLNGFDGLTWDYKKDINENALKKNSKFIKEIINEFKQNEIGGGVGYYENDNEKIYDNYIIFNNSGNEIINYKRITEGWKEPKACSNCYCEGSFLPIFYLSSNNQKIRCSIALCGDLWDDDLFNRYRVSDASLILWPMYVDYSIQKWENYEKNEYFKRIKLLNKNVLMVNSIKSGEDFANGGAYFVNGRGVCKNFLSLQKQDILVVDI